ncbi:MAG: c-type cytochrome [Ilumatobacteraceae bacterium]
MNRAPLVTRVALGASALLSLLVVTAACGSSSGNAAIQQTGVVKPLSGSDVYLMSCARCHGADRLGKTDAPKLDTVRMASIGDEPMRALITYGKGRMPGFGGLTDERVDALIAYLRNN